MFAVTRAMVWLSMLKYFSIVYCYFIFFSPYNTCQSVAHNILHVKRLNLKMSVLEIAFICEKKFFFFFLVTIFWFCNKPTRFYRNTVRLLLLAWRRFSNNRYRYKIYYQTISETYLFVVVSSVGPVAVFTVGTGRIGDKEDISLAKAFFFFH